FQGDSGHRRGTRPGRVAPRRRGARQGRRGRGGGRRRGWRHSRLGRVSPPPGPRADAPRDPRGGRARESVTGSPHPVRPSPSPGEGANPLFPAPFALLPPASYHYVAAFLPSRRILALVRRRDG